MGIRVVVVGCGQIARQSHIPTILKNPDFDLIALVDPIKEIGNGILREFGISANVYNHIDKLPDCDAAIVSVPPHLHASISISLLKRGIHVLCEKPMATNIRDAKDMMKTASEQGVVLLIGMTKHYCSNTELTKDILEDGMLGRIESYELESGRRSGWNAANPKRYDPGYVLGGVVFENGVHWIYRLLYWFGYPRIISYEDDRIDGVEANALIKCLHDFNREKIQGTITFSSDHALRNKLTVVGTKGIAEIFEKYENAVYVLRTVNNKKRILAIQGSLEGESRGLIELEMEDFARAITDGKSPMVPTEIAVESIEFIQEAYSIRKDIYQPWVFKNILLTGDLNGN